MKRRSLNEHCSRDTPSLNIFFKKQEILNFTYSDSVTQSVSDETHIFFGPNLSMYPVRVHSQEKK